jgi:multicomponent Na+:H+ antiporter subunit F
MSTVFAVTGVLLAGAGALTLYRLLRGPTVYDRIVALEMLVVVTISGVAVDAAAQGDGAGVTLIVAVVLVGFISSVSVLRLMPEERL